MNKTMWIALALAACGSKDPKQTNETPARAEAGASARAGVAIAQLDGIEYEVAGLAAEGAKMEDLIAKLAPKLGAPTLIDAAQVTHQEATWAGYAGDACEELRLFVEDGKLKAEHTRWDVDDGEDYAACLDAAHGSAIARRFRDAAELPLHGEDEAAMTARIAATLGKPSVRDRRDDDHVAVAWASRDDLRCTWVIASIDSISSYVSGGAAAAGMPWYDECAGWAAGKPDALFAEDLDDAAHFAALTAASAPRRVIVAHGMFDRARAGARTRDDLARRLGPAMVEADFAAWAIEDGAHCTGLAFSPSQDPRVARIDVAPADRAWRSCVAIAHRDLHGTADALATK